jgi:hypothetical protein
VSSAFGDYERMQCLVLLRREELRHELQRLVPERIMFVPIYESAGLTGIGPRLAKPGLGLLSTYQWSGPYEAMQLKP